MTPEGFYPAARLHKDLRRGRAYYTIRWSPLRPANRYEIGKIVPAMSGIYELYYRAEDGRLRLFHYGKAWLGGLRAVIREYTDPELMKDRPDIRTVLSARACFYRFSVCDSLPDMEDLISFFSASENRGGPPAASSGRYSEIRLNEIDG